MPLQRASFPSSGQISGQSHVRAEGGVIIHVALLRDATGKASFCSNNGSDLFFVVKLNPSNVSKVCESEKSKRTVIYGLC